MLLHKVRQRLVDQGLELATFVVGKRADSRQDLRIDLRRKFLSRHNNFLSARFRHPQDFLRLASLLKPSGEQDMEMIEEILQQRSGMTDIAEVGCVCSLGAATSFFYERLNLTG
jgi:hypothetical protein